MLKLQDIQRLIWKWNANLYTDKIRENFKSAVEFFKLIGSILAKIIKIKLTIGFISSLKIIKSGDFYGINYIFKNFHKKIDGIFLVFLQNVLFFYMLQNSPFSKPFIFPLVFLIYNYNV